MVAVEPTAAPTLTEGRFEYDFGDQAGMTPLMPMYTLGADFIPAPIHAGGLRYHGDSPLVSLLRKEDHIEAVAYPQSKVFEAAVQFARTEGILPAPEPAHAIRAVIDEALRCKEEGRPRRSSSTSAATATSTSRPTRTTCREISSMSDPTARRGARPGRAAEVPHRPDPLGHFGDWGGRFVPEVLMAALDQLTEAFEDAIADPAFDAELDALRRDYAGRPTPLFRARRLSEELGCGCGSSARTCSTPGPTSSTTPSASTCWPAGWASRG